MSNFIRYFGLIAVCFVFVTPVQAGNAIGQQDTEEITAFVFAAMRSGREKIRTGHFECRQTTSFGMTRDMESWFDNPATRLHTRMVETKRNESAQQHEFARSPDSLVTKSARGKVISVKPPHNENPDWANTLDIRNFGLAYYTDLFSVDTRYEDTLRHYQTEPPTVAEKLDNGIVHLQWKLAEARLLRDLWIDGKRGYWPTRMELRMLNAPDEKPFSTNELEVEQVDGVWVPARYVCRSGDEVRELKFTWKSLNKELDSNQFEYKSFDMDGVTMVADSRLGEPIILERRKEQMIPKKRGYLRWLLTGAVGIAVVVALSFCFRSMSGKAPS